ncbi:GNAT family N-acetyltransferase [Paenibacillus dendritiformis]|uniref:GNAT family N-acetyltransferase n=1 Tax=Paenibacillus dendritiformis TaxID=130049 RepID=UPI0034D976E8
MLACPECRKEKLEISLSWIGISRLARSYSNSNVPDYFAAVERKDFDAYLDDLKGPYFVMEEETGAIVACGGYAAEEEDPTIAVLCWGMVRRDLHRCGFGRQLLAERLRRIAAEPQLPRDDRDIAIQPRFFRTVRVHCGKGRPGRLRAGLGEVLCPLSLIPCCMERNIPPNRLLPFPA